MLDIGHQFVELGALDQREDVGDRVEGQAGVVDAAPPSSFHRGSSRPTPSEKRRQQCGLQLAAPMALHHERGGQSIEGIGGDRPRGDGATPRRCSSLYGPAASLVVWALLKPSVENPWHGATAHTNEALCASRRGFLFGGSAAALGGSPSVGPAVVPALDGAGAPADGVGAEALGTGKVPAFTMR